MVFFYKNGRKTSKTPYCLVLADLTTFSKDFDTALPANRIWCHSDNAFIIEAELCTCVK